MPGDGHLSFIQTKNHNKPKTFIKCYDISIFLPFHLIIAKILTMINIDLLTMSHSEMMSVIASNAKKRRKQYSMTQRELATRAGVSYASYRRFEETGQISLDSFVRIARVLDCDKELMELFTKKHYNSIEEALGEKRK